MRRGVPVVIGFAVIVAGVTLATISILSGPDSARVGHVVCEHEGVRVLTPSVLAGQDGVALEVTNIGTDRRYEISSRGAPAVGGILPADDVVDLQLGLAPGEVTFGCVRAGSGELVTGRFRLEDPDGLWTPEALACADPDSGVFETEYAVEPFEDTARRALPGLRATDRLVKPGYPDTEWHGELHVVVRDGRNVGRVVRVLNHGSWNVIVDACPGSGLTDGSVAETGAA